MLRFSLLCSLLALSLPTALALTTLHCKAVPWSPSWPAQAEWAALNASVSGKLIAPTPPGAVCHPEYTQFNSDTCKLVASQWTNTSFHALNAVSVDYNDITCLPDELAPCSTQGYPAYVIEAGGVKDIQAGVNFAREKFVRLVIKGTGHDFLGRSSGASSLSIYTHNIRGIELRQNDTRAVKYGGSASIKIMAGERMTDVYNAAAEHNITVVGGADMGVGIGGWISSGGHGPLSAKYGLGADQVLEMEVVTADGQLRTINETSDQDLFWAMRGGGAGTFAVLVSVTLKAYPSITSSEYFFAYNTTGNSDTFWSMDAYFHTQLPRLSHAGVMGYYFNTPVTAGETNSSIAGKITGAFLGPELSPEQLTSLMAPIEAVLRRQSGSPNSTLGPDPIFVQGKAIFYKSFSHMYIESEGQTAGTHARMGDRILDAKALGSFHRSSSSTNSTGASADIISTSAFRNLRTALRTANPPPWTMYGHLIAGAGTRSPPGGVPGRSNAISPTWRDAVTHLVLPRMWSPFNTTQKTRLTTRLREVEVDALRRLAPDTGSYFSESDPTEPHWQRAYWGANYKQLFEIKVARDPTGVFYCHHCVGSELWDTYDVGSHGEMVTGLGLEAGVGQDLVRLCRVR